jgi:hypothetical protein
MPTNPFLVPPRLLGRALDDLHAIAEAARALPLSEVDPTRIVREALDDLDAVADAARRLSEVERTLTERVDRVEIRLGELLEILASLDGRTASVEGHVTELSGRAGDLGTRARGLEESADRLTAMIDRIPGV